MKSSGAYSQKVYYFGQERLACNGKPGMKTTNDVCGVCGGKGECMGCDGIPNSGQYLLNSHYPLLSDVFTLYVFY